VSRVFHAFIMWTVCSLLLSFWQRCLMESARLRLILGAPSYFVMV
jgi:hypothetical protein